MMAPSNTHNPGTLPYPLGSCYTIDSECTEMEQIDGLLVVDPPTAIDHCYFPHLFDAIVRDASLATLLALRATSRTLRDRIDGDLSQISITERPDALFLTSGRRISVVEARTESGYVLWSIPLVPQRDSPQQQVVLKVARDDFRMYASFLVARGTPITIDVHGDPGREFGFVENIFNAALGDGIRIPRGPSPRVRFRIIPDADGVARTHGYSWDGPRILIDNWRARRDKVEPICSGLSRKPFVFAITGTEAAHIATTIPPPGSTVVYDFSAWQPCAALPTSSISTPSGPPAVLDADFVALIVAGVPAHRTNARMANFIAHILLMLSTECAVYIFSLDRVDKGWLDPFFVSGEPWSLAPGGSRGGAPQDPHEPRGPLFPFGTYLRDAVIRGAHAFGCVDIVPDLDHTLNIMPLRYAWQSYCSW